MLIAVVALLLNSYAPAVAFSGNDAGGPAVVVADACNSGARVVSPAEPDFPNGVKVAHPVSAQVVVNISSTGAVTGAAIHKSSGYPAIDNAALDAARKSTYDPAKRDCKPVAGTYLFNTTFSPN